MADVFISYSKTDEAAVRRLAEAVKALGYAVWWDEELPAHVSYSDVIADKIASAKAAIVVWSEHAAASQWVRAEADLARNRNKLIQASIDGRLPPMPFNQIQCATIGDWRGEAGHQGWLKIKASLAALVGPPAAGAEPILHPLPATPPPAAPHKWHKPLIAVIAAAFLFVAGAGLYAWLRGGAPEPAPRQAVQAPAMPAKPKPPPPAPREARPRAAAPAPQRTAAARPRPPGSAQAAPAPASKPAAPAGFRSARRMGMRARFGRRR
jgi:hypothetical protein